MSQSTDAVPKDSLAAKTAGRENVVDQSVTFSFEDLAAVELNEIQTVNIELEYKKFTKYFEDQKIADRKKFFCGMYQKLCVEGKKTKVNSVIKIGGVTIVRRKPSDLEKNEFAYPRACAIITAWLWFNKGFPKHVTSALSSQVGYRGRSTESENGEPTTRNVLIVPGMQFIPRIFDFLDDSQESSAGEGSKKKGKKGEASTESTEGISFPPKNWFYYTALVLDAVQRVKMDVETTESPTAVALLRTNRHDDMSEWFLPISLDLFSPSATKSSDLQNTISSNSKSTINDIIAKIKANK